MYECVIEIRNRIGTNSYSKRSMIVILPKQWNSGCAQAGGNRHTWSDHVEKLLCKNELPTTSIKSKSIPGPGLKIHIFVRFLYDSIHSKWLLYMRVNRFLLGSRRLRPSYCIREDCVWFGNPRSSHENGTLPDDEVTNVLLDLSFN